MSNKYLIDTVIEKAKAHNLSLIRENEEKLSRFPRGSLMIRETNGRKYCYFRYRDGKKVITKYAGTEAKLAELQDMLAEREKIAATIRELKAEIERIEKMEAVK